MSKLNPDNQFVPTFEKVRRIMARYNLPLSKYEAANSGIENVTLIVWSSESRYVLRVYRQGKKSYAEIELELDFMTALRQGGLPVPALIPTANGELFAISKFGEHSWQSVLMEFATDHHSKPYTLALVADMAKNQAKMHLIGEEYARSRNLASERHELRLDEASDEDESYNDFLQRGSAFVVKLDELLPTGLSHFDYDAENLFADGNSRVTAIFDFDDVQCLPLVVCLGYTLWDIATECRELVQHYVNEYERIRPLNEAEKAILPQVILFRHYMVIGIDIQLGDTRLDDFEDAEWLEPWIRDIKFD